MRKDGTEPLWGCVDQHFLVLCQSHGSPSSRMSPGGSTWGGQEGPRIVRHTGWKHCCLLLGLLSL